KPVIGILAIAALASSAAINVAAAQQGPATERVQPTPLAGGGPGKLPSPGEGPAATIPSHPETGRVEPTPLAGGGPGTLPPPTATAPAAQPSRSSERQRYNGDAYRYGDRGGRYYDGRSYGGGVANFGGSVRVLQRRLRLLPVWQLRFHAIQPGLLPAASHPYARWLAHTSRQCVRLAIS